MVRYSASERCQKEICELGDSPFAGQDPIGINTAADGGDTALYNAARHGHYEIVQLLLEHGAEAVLPRYKGFTPINVAASKGRVKVVELLLDQDQIDFETPDDEGRGPLYYAAFGGHYEVVRLLLDRGADATVLSKEGFAPCHVASQNGHTKIVELLLDETDFDINAPATSGATALYLAARYGYVETLRTLLERGAETAVLVEGGWTALNAAASKGHLEVVKLLLEHTDS